MISFRSLHFVFPLFAYLVLANGLQLLLGNDELVEDRYESVNQEFEGFLDELRIACSENLNSGIDLLNGIHRRNELNEINRLRLIYEEAYLQMEVSGTLAAKAVLGEFSISSEKANSLSAINPLLYAQYRRIEALKLYLDHPHTSARQSSEIFREILPILKQCGTAVEVVETYVSQSYDHEMLDETDEALQLLVEAREYAMDSGDPVSTAIVDSSLGFWAFHTKSPNMEFIENLNLASQFFQETNNEYQLLLANMVILHNQPIVSAEEELKHLDISIELAKKLGAKESLSNVLKMKAAYFAEINQWEKAIQSIEESIHLASKLNSEDLEFWHSLELCHYLVEVNQPKYDDQAFQLIDDMLEIAIDVQDHYAEANLKHDLAKLLFRQEKYAEMISLLDVSIAFFTEHDYPGDLGRASALKSKALFELGDVDAAYRLLKTTYDFGESEWDKNYRKEVAVASVFLNNTVKENELKLTQMANELAQTQIAEQSLRLKYQDQQAKQNQDQLRSAIVLFLVLFVLLFFLAISYQRKKRAESELKILTHALQKEKELLLKEQRLHVEANKELHASIIRQKEIDEDRKNILGIAAHDMKNPLAAIESTLEMAKLELEDMDLPKENSLFEYLSLCFESSEYLGKLIQNILRARKSDSEADLLDLRWFNPISVVEQTIAMNQQNAASKGMRLLFSSAVELDVRCDPQGLREALDNLVSNAIKYSFHGATIEISLRENGDRLVFEVKDEGPGLLEKDMEDIFKPFSKLSARPTGGESSNGLGLSSVKRVVEAMNGEIIAGNRAEGGAIFSLSLDARPSTPQETVLQV